MAKIYITDYIRDPSIELSILGDKLALVPSEEVEVLLVWHQAIDAEYIKQFPRLKGVVRYGVGFDSLNLDVLKGKNIIACNTPDYGTDEVSDTALAMILNITRGIHYYNERSKKILNDPCPSWQENILKSIKRSSSLRIGIIGAGRIGSSLLRKLDAVGYQTCFYDINSSVGFEKIFRNTQRFFKLEDLLAASDVVSLHIPLGPQTEGIVNNKFINMMKPGAALINTARGKLLADLDLLYEKLLDGHLSFIGLDVLPDEPPLPTSKLIKEWIYKTELSERILINPHTAYYSEQAFIEMRTKACLNALRILNGEEPHCRLI